MTRTLNEPWEKTQAPAHPIEEKELFVRCHENHIPSYIEKELERLYQSVYSSFTYLKMNGSLEKLSTYEVRRDGTAIAIFLFQREKNRVRVMNEVTYIDGEEIARFVNYVFFRFKSVTLISFRAIQTSIHRLPFPYQLCNCLEDIVISLPSTVEEYLSRLGSATRKTIRKSIRRTRSDFPSCEFRVLTGDDIDLPTVQEIFNLKKARMKNKNEIFAVHDEEVERTHKLAQACGMVGVILIDGRICAGSISYRSGAHYFLLERVHDLLSKIARKAK